MHEYGLASDILKLVEIEAKRNKVSKVVGIKLKVGRANMVTPEELQEAFDIVSKDSLASGAKLDVEITEGIEIQPVHIETLEE